MECQAERKSGTGSGMSLLAKEWNGHQSSKQGNSPKDRIRSKESEREQGTEEQASQTKAGEEGTHIESHRQASLRTQVRHDPSEQRLGHIVAQREDGDEENSDWQGNDKRKGTRGSTANSDAQRDQAIASPVVRRPPNEGTEEKSRDAVPKQGQADAHFPQPIAPGKGVAKPGEGARVKESSKKDIGIRAQAPTLTQECSIRGMFTLWSKLPIC